MNYIACKWGKKAEFNIAVNLKHTNFLLVYLSWNHCFQSPKLAVDLKIMLILKAFHFNQ